MMDLFPYAMLSVLSLSPTHIETVTGSLEGLTIILYAYELIGLIGKWLSGSFHCYHLTYK